MKFEKVYKEGIEQYYKNSRYTKQCKLCGKEFSVIGYEDEVCKDCLTSFHTNIRNKTNDAVKRINSEKEHHMINTRR